MDPIGGTATIAQVCLLIYQTWGEMKALKKELQPFRDVTRAVEDCIGEEEDLFCEEQLCRVPKLIHFVLSISSIARADPDHPPRLTRRDLPCAGPVRNALEAAADFLLEHKKANKLERFLQGADLRAKACQLLVTISQAMQPLQLQVSNASEFARRD